VHRLENTPLKGLLPCKPDQGSRQMPMAGVEVDMHMSGCEAGGALFAIAWVEVKEASQAGPALAQWQSAMLANMQAVTTQIADFSPRGASEQPKGVRVTATGRRQDGRAVLAQGAWFVRGTQVFHAVIYADKLNPDAVETFFSGLEFQ
jgi:hypothetical protein